MITSRAVIGARISVIESIKHRAERSVMLALLAEAKATLTAPLDVCRTHEIDGTEWIGKLNLRHSEYFPSGVEVDLLGDTSGYAYRDVKLDVCIGISIDRCAYAARRRFIKGKPVVTLRHGSPDNGDGAYLYWIPTSRTWGDMNEYLTMEGV